jgi:hypothetical protein
MSSYYAPIAFENLMVLYLAVLHEQKVIQIRALLIVDPEAL